MRKRTTLLRPLLLAMIDFRVISHARTEDESVRRLYHSAVMTALVSVGRIRHTRVTTHDNYVHALHPTDYWEERLRSSGTSALVRCCCPDLIRNLKRMIETWDCQFDVSQTFRRIFDEARGSVCIRFNDFAMCGCP